MYPRTIDENWKEFFLDRLGTAERTANAPVFTDFSGDSIPLKWLIDNFSDASTSKGKTTVLTGSPMLVQVWAYERFQIGRPSPAVDNESYGSVDDEIDRPTMGSWWLQKLAWSKNNSHNALSEFSCAFNALTDSEVTWTYEDSNPTIVQRAPNGLSSLCTRDSDFWLTTKALVCDAIVEGYFPHRVMRQFGLHQSWPVPLHIEMLAEIHRLSRKGKVKCKTLQEKVQNWVQEWRDARTSNVVETRPHSDMEYMDYKKWYLQNTRTFVDPPKGPEYPLHRDQSRREYSETLIQVTSYLDYYKNVPDMTVEQCKMVLEHLSGMCKQAIDSDAMIPPAPIPQLTTTGPAGLYDDSTLTNMDGATSGLSNDDNSMGHSTLDSSTNMNNDGSPGVCNGSNPTNMDYDTSGPSNDDNSAPGMTDCSTTDNTPTSMDSGPSASSDEGNRGPPNDDIAGDRPRARLRNPPNTFSFPKDQTYAAKRAAKAQGNLRKAAGKTANRTQDQNATAKPAAAHAAKTAKQKHAKNKQTKARAEPDVA